MWRNTDVAALIDWMREHNAGVRDLDRRAGFYGLDLYNMSGSIAAVLDYLDKVDPQAAAIARERYGCLTPWQKEPSTYGRAVLTSGYRKCEQVVVEQCRDLLKRRLEYGAQDGESFLDAAQNARLVGFRVFGPRALARYSSILALIFRIDARAVAEHLVDGGFPDFPACPGTGDDHVQIVTGRAFVGNEVPVDSRWGSVCCARAGAPSCKSASNSAKRIW